MPGQPPNPLIGPQQANVLVPPGVQNPQGGNNPVGFIGRFFGPAVRPPNPTLNRQPAQNPNHNNQGQPGGPGIFINYQVQYQFPRQPNERNGQTMHAPQQPIPPYPGFPGPGGVWQPWPGAANGAQPTEAGNPGNIHTDAPLNSPLPEGGESSLDSSVSTTSSAASGSSSLDNHSSSESPREAAARAALNRLGGGKPGNSSQQATFTSTTTETHSSSASNPRPAMPSDIPGRNAHLPQLIPLYGYPSQSANLRASTQLDSSTQHTLPPTPPSQSSIHPTSSLPFPSSGYAQSSASPSPFNPQPSSANTFPSQLPASLTDEQLATLDRLTRESIDERLRILEGVSGTIYKCVDDLLRLRSALPHPNPPLSLDGSIPPSSSGPQTDHAEGEGTSTSYNKGKKPEHLVQVVNDTQVSQGSEEDP